MHDETSPAQRTIAPGHTVLSEPTGDTVRGALLPPPPLRAERPLPRVEGYEVLAEVGCGGMGVVYKALHLRLKRVVALKMLRPSSGLSATEWEALLSRFRREAEALARLRHPHIVEVYDVGETPSGTPYFSLEFCSGGSLDAHLGGKPLPPAEATALLQTLARAVRAAHEAGIVHRDLKPANVLMSCEPGLVSAGSATAPGADATGLATYVPKITDFGLARKLDEVSQTLSGAVFGTPSYMAPEQARGRSHEAGPAADVWALGAILYECLTGRPPFQGATVMETLLQVMSDEPVPPRQLNPRVPRDLDVICLKCLHKDPARRYTSAAALADDLGRCQRGESIQARTTGMHERAWRWARRRPLAAGLLAALLVVLVGGVASLFAWQRAELCRHSQQEAHRREALLRARHQENVALAQQKAARLQSPAAFTRVAALMNEALQTLPDDPALQDERERLQERCASCERLARAHEEALTQGRAAWFYSGEEQPPATRRACERALASFGVLEQPDWWTRSPATDLTAAQQKELHDEVYRLLLLLSALRIQQGFHKLVLLSPAESKQAARAAADTLARARALEQASLVRPCRTIALLEKGSGWLLGKASPSQPVVAPYRDEVDGFFLGVTHLFLGRHRNDWLTQLIRRIGPGDFDFVTPLETARQQLRRAVQADPEQYWAWFMLGRALSLDVKDAEGAKLAFTTCVVLRPDYSRGLEHRALVNVLRAVNTKDTALRGELLAAAARDSARGEALAPFEPSTWWVRGEMHRLQGQDRQAIDSYAHALLLEEQLAERASRRNLLAGVRATVARTPPGDPDARVLLALIQMETEKDGAVKALPLLDAVLRDRPAHPLALLARGRALERLAAWSKALAAYERIRTGTGWQRVEGQRGRERMLLRLGRTEEAR